tara:strand:- start:1790 stop:2302 length:513 start_codon:yes stop_codon:yes gene_type:complete
MKNFISLVTLICLFMSCNDNTHKCEVPTNGFGPYEGQTIYMGSESTIDVFKQIDVAWTNRDYETLKSLISDGGNFTFEDGTNVSTGDEFTSKIEKEYQESLEKGQEWGWKIDYAFAVHPKGSDDPNATNQKGEWVNAQFSGQDGIYIEWYQIVNGKLVRWNQAKAQLPKK